MASNIRVVLEVDNKKYIAEVRQAQAATRQFADTTSKSTEKVSTSFDKLRNNSEALSNKLQGLRGVILGAAVGSILRFADSMADLSVATGIAVENIVGLTQTFQANGGSAEGARKAIFNLNQQIEEAANGTLEAQDNFRRLGINLRDLRTLSEQDLLAKTIDGLSKITSASERTTLAQKMLGKEARGVNFAGVAAGYASAVAEAQRYSESIRRAAEVQDKLEATLNKLQLALTNAIGPITDFVSKLDQAKINAFVDALVKIGVVVGSLIVFSKAATWVANLLAVFTRLSTGGPTTAAAIGGVSQSVKMFREGLDTVKKTGEIFAYQLGRIASTGEITGATMNGLAKRLQFLLGGFARMLPLIGQVVAGIMLLNSAVEVLTGKSLGGWFDEAAAGLEKLVTNKFPALARLINELGKKLGMAPSPAQKSEDDAELTRIKNRAKTLEQEKKLQEDIRAVRDRVAEAAAKESLETKQYVNELQIGLSRQREAIASETALLELSKLKNVISEDQVEILREQGKAADELANIQRRLKDEIDNVRLSMKAMDPKSSEYGIAANKVQELNNRLTAVTEAYRVHNDSLEYNITRQQTINKLIEAQNRDREISIKLIEDQIARQQLLGDSLRSINEQKIQLKLEGELIGLGGLERQLKEIELKSKEAVRAAQAAFAEGFIDEDGMSAERAEEFAAGLDRISKAYKGISAAQIENLTKSREFSTGLRESIQDYVSEATNAANQARTLFDTFARGFEDAIVRFVQTGKLSFRDLANSIIAEFVRIEAKRLVSGIFGGVSGGGGIYDFFKAIAGRAMGGPVSANTPYLIGERGPELFLPKTAGQVIPNHQLDNMKLASNQTSVTYNINAVDAASFRQMVSRDPEFIFAVTERGRQALPRR